jgi:hypothetical protein
MWPHPLGDWALADGVKDGSVDAQLPPALLLLCTLSVGAVPQIVRRALGSRSPFGKLPEGDALARLLVRILFHGIGQMAVDSGGRKLLGSRSPAQ